MSKYKVKCSVTAVLVLTLVLIFATCFFGQTENAYAAGSNQKDGLIVEIMESETYVFWRGDVDKTFGKNNKNICEYLYLKFVPQKAGKYHFVVETGDNSEIYFTPKVLTPEIKNLLGEGDSDKYFKLGGPVIGNRDLKYALSQGDYEGDYTDYINPNGSFKRVMRGNIPYYYNLDLSGCEIDEPVQIKVVYEGPVTKSEFITDKVEASEARISRLESKKTGVKITMSSGCPYKVDGFNIYRSKSKSGKYKKIGTTKKNTYIDKTVKNKTRYYYKVKAYRVIDGEKVYTGWKSGLESSIKGDGITYSRP